MIGEITPQELVEELASANPPLVLDVREPHEWDLAPLPASVKIPLGQLDFRFDELDKDANWVVVCRSGGRSGKACQLLESEGFTQVRNMVGGSLRWSDDVDSNIPKY